MVKNPPGMQETRAQCLSWEDPLEKGMAIHSSILAWRISWTEKPGRLQFTGSQRVRQGRATNKRTNQLHVLPTGGYLLGIFMRYAYMPTAMEGKNSTIPSDFKELKHVELSSITGGKTVQQCLLQLNIRSRLEPEILLLGICPQETNTSFHKPACKHL